MAIAKDIFTEDLGITADYIAVKEIQFYDRKARILCGVWLNREMKVAEKAPLKTLMFEVELKEKDATCPKAWAYLTLKELDFFAGASDILE